jgi:protease-4
MSQTSDNPSGPADLPAAAPPVVPQIVIHTRGSALQRLVCLLGWLGCLVFLLLFVGQSVSLQEYFDTSDGIQQKHHSGPKNARGKVAIIAIRGAILEGDGFAKKQIDRVRQDDDVRAVVVRVDSPGGTITGSDYLYHHLTQLRKERKIPLVVSMGSIAASGGYYVSMAVGDQERSIYAEPTTTTGSIGVIMPHYDLSGLLERFDVANDSIVSHPRKQLMSMTKPISDEDRRILQAYVDEAFARFKDVVAEGRPAFEADRAALDELATGEIFTANQALRHGLVDEIGFIEQAIDRAIELAGLDKDATRVVQYEQPASLLDLPWPVASSGAGDLSALLELNAPRAYYLATTLPPLITQQSQAATARD